MPRKPPAPGFTLIELIVVVAVVAVLVGVGANRLAGYQEAAEAAAAESSFITLRSALHIRSAELIAANRWDELRRLAELTFKMLSL
jgi:prepilin-type N-terminal cleavage/methylation domain-containing protein